MSTERQRSTIVTWQQLLLAGPILAIIFLIHPPRLARLTQVVLAGSRWTIILFILQVLLVAALIVAIWPISSWQHWLEDTFPTFRSASMAAVSIMLGVGFALLLLEVALRLLGLPFRANWTPSENALAIYDAELGWSYVPNQSITQTFGSDNRDITMHFNEFGARVADLDQDIDPARPTVIFVGGSFTMGHGVMFEDSFVGVLEQEELFPYQVVNLGVQAYGTDQAMLMLNRALPNFNVVAVVYTYLDIHMIRNANHDRREIIPSARFLATKPQFGINNDGHLFLRHKPERIEEHHYLRLKSTLGVVGFKMMQLPRSWRVPPDPALTNALVAEMRDDAAEHGAAFWVVNWRWPDQQVSWRESSPFAATSVNVIETEIGNHDAEHTQSIPGDGHPDEAAHRYVASLILAELTSQMAVHE